MDFCKDDIVWNLMDLKLTPVMPLDCFASSLCKKEQDEKNHTDTSTANTEKTRAAKKVKMPSVLLRKSSMPELSPGHPDVCVDCEKGVCDSCPLHHQWKRIQNREYYLDPEGLSQVKVPGWATVATSNIPGAGLGLFARQKVKYGVHLGRYRGVRRDPSTVSKNEDMSYVWEIKQNGKVVSIIDGSDPKRSNYLRYINCACNESEQNLVAYQFKGNIFYRTAREIESGEELLVWYGKEYAKNLGIVDSSMSLGPLSPESVPKENPTLKESAPGRSAAFNESVKLIISSKTMDGRRRHSVKPSSMVPCAPGHVYQKVPPISPSTIKPQEVHTPSNKFHHMFHARVRHSSIHMNIVPQSTGPVCSYMVNLEDGHVSVAGKSPSSWVHRPTAQSVKRSIKYRCPLCSELLNSKGKVYYHIKKYHRCSLISRGSPYYCKKCNNWHKSAYTLWNHLKTLRKDAVQKTSIQGGFQNCYKNRENVIPSSEGTEIIDVETF